LEAIGITRWRGAVFFSRQFISPLIGTRTGILFIPHRLSSVSECSPITSSAGRATIITTSGTITRPRMCTVAFTLRSRFISGGTATIPFTPTIGGIIGTIGIGTIDWKLPIAIA
jgi:hypothetical protein